MFSGCSFASYTKQPVEPDSIVVNDDDNQNSYVSNPWTEVTKADVEEKLSDIKAKIFADMVALDQMNYSTPTGLKIVRKLDSIRKSFDVKGFTSSNPDLDLTPYWKESKVAGSLSIAV